MKKVLFLSVTVLSVLTFFAPESKDEVFFDSNNLQWWAKAMANDGESGGTTHSLECDNGVGVCSGECGIHQVKLTKNGNANTATFKCGS